MNARFVISCAGAGFALLLGGCSSVSTPSDARNSWTPPDEARKTDRVWSDVREQAVKLDKPLALTDLADLALRNNPAVKSAWLDARAAAEQVVHARGYFMPAVTGTLGASRQSLTASPKEIGQQPLGSDLLKYGPGLQVNYLVLNFGGGYQAAVDQALQTVYATDFTFNRTIQTILVGVESAYYSLVSAQTAVEAAETSVKDAQTALDAAQERSKSGMGTALEVLQAQTGLDQAHYNLANAKGLVLIARGGLAQAIDVPADTVLQIKTPEADVPGKLEEITLRRMIDDAMQSRPDIAALRAQADARRAAVKVAGASQWPNLYVNGGISRDEYENYGGNPLQDSDWAMSAGVSLQWTIFDGLQTRSAKRIAEAQAEAAIENLKQAELAASADVWTRFHTYETALEKYAAIQALMKSTSASYDLALDSYKAGLKSILDLLNAETQLAQARSQQVATRQEVFIALANLAYSTGLMDNPGGAGKKFEMRNLRSEMKPKP